MRRRRGACLRPAGNFDRLAYGDFELHLGRSFSRLLLDGSTACGLTAKLAGLPETPSLDFASAEWPPNAPRFLVAGSEAVLLQRPPPDGAIVGQGWKQVLRGNGSEHDVAVHRFVDGGVERRGPSWPVAATAEVRVVMVVE